MAKIALNHGSPKITTLPPVDGVLEDGTNDAYADKSREVPVQLQKTQMKMSVFTKTEQYFKMAKFPSILTRQIQNTRSKYDGTARMVRSSEPYGMVHGMIRSEHCATCRPFGGDVNDRRKE